MLSMDHEFLVDIFKNRPSLAAEILDEVLGVPIPDYTEARITSADLTQIQPAEYRADIVVLLLHEGTTVRVVIVEVVNGAELASMHSGRAGELVRRGPAEARLLLGDARDLQILENVDVQEVSRRLDLATTQVDALHVCLILLDGSLSKDTRGEAAQELDEFLGDDYIQSFLESILFSRPLPEDADLLGGYTLCKDRTERAQALLKKLDSLQLLIREVYLAWESIPLATFATEENKVQALSAAVREGLFRDLVLLRDADGSVQLFMVTALRNTTFAKVRGARDIVKTWVSPLKEKSEPARELNLSYESLNEWAFRKTPKNFGGQETEAASLRKLKLRRKRSLQRCGGTALIALTSMLTTW